ncbi:MAG: antibiotic biosynthesis monooxygenase family protein [Bacillota bacterium]
MNHPKVVELVIFKLKEGAQADDFIKLSHQADRALQSFPGFNTRTLFYSKTTDQWVDIVYWSDLESAKNAKESVMTLPETQPFIQSIEEKEMTFLHLNIEEQAGMIETLKNPNTIELVRFQLKDGINPELLIKAVRETNPVIQEHFSSFEARMLLKDVSEPGWIDLVYWSDMKSALQAAEQFPTLEAFQPFIAMLKPEGITMLHLEPKI